MGVKPTFSFHFAPYIVQCFTMSMICSVNLDIMWSVHCAKMPHDMLSKPYWNKPVLTMYCTIKCLAVQVLDYMRHEIYVLHLITFTMSHSLIKILFSLLWDHRQYMRSHIVQLGVTYSTWLYMVLICSPYSAGLLKTSSCFFLYVWGVWYIFLQSLLLSPCPVLSVYCLGLARDL